MKKTCGILIISALIIAIVFAIFYRGSSMSSKGVFVNGIQISDEAGYRYIDDQHYVSFDLLVGNDLLDAYYDQQDKTIYIYKSYNRLTLDLPLESDRFMVEDQKVFISTVFVGESMEAGYTIEVDKESVYIDNNYYHVVANRSFWVYESPSQSIRNRFGKISSGTTLRGYSYDNEWVVLKYNDGIGYAKKQNVSINKVVTPPVELLNQESKKIVMAWDFFTRKPNAFVTPTLVGGLNAISPTWHDLEEDFGYTDWSLAEYVEYYQRQNIEVWPAFTNSFDPSLTSKMLNDPTYRSNTIKQIINIAIQNQYDGINLDYENIYLEDKEVFAVFVRDLYIASRNANLSMSVDITILSQSPTWSLFYDRKTIGKYSDYVMLMAYDERTRPEHGIGPIASIPWVENGLKGLVELVPANKIVLGIPFYTRLWETIYENGSVRYDVTALRLQTAINFVNNHDFTFEFDAQAGQNYGEATDGNILYQIWMEDTVSLENRLDLVYDFDLAGVAVWALDYGTPEMWEVIEKRFWGQ